MVEHKKKIYMPQTMLPSIKKEALEVLMKTFSQDYAFKKLLVIYF